MPNSVRFLLMPGSVLTLLSALVAGSAGGINAPMPLPNPPVGRAIMGSFQTYLVILFDYDQQPL